MCKCFDEMKEKVIEKLKESIGEHTEFDGRWRNRAFFFGANPPDISIVIPFEASYRSIKTNGKPYKNKTNIDKSVVMSYCPFCGIKTNQ